MPHLHGGAGIPGPADSRDGGVMDCMIGQYRDVAFALDLAIQSSRVAFEPQIEIKSGLREQSA